MSPYLVQYTATDTSYNGATCDMYITVLGRCCHLLHCNKRGVKTTPVLFILAVHSQYEYHGIIKYYFNTPVIAEANKNCLVSGLGAARWHFVFIIILFAIKRCPIEAKFDGSIGILPCCVLNDFFT